MRRSCKHIDITDVATVREWVSWCIAGHYKKRRDFVRLMDEHGYIPSDNPAEESLSWWKAVDSVSHDITMMIKNRKLELEPVRISEKIDKNSGKMRLIGCESALQQCLDYVAVHSCMEIWQRRVDPLQASSLRGRGQLFVLRKLQKTLKKDNARVEYGRKHKVRYSRRCRFFAKTDVKSCFKSGRKEKFLKLFVRDCANEDIIWLWGALLETHHVWYVNVKGERLFYEGFLIGALTSQFAMIYMLSFASARLRSHGFDVFCFMDDFMIIGSNRKRMVDGIQDMESFMQDELGLSIKLGWSIQRITESTPLDFVGYRVYHDGKIEIRRRNIRKILRYIHMPFLTFKQCKTIASMKGMVNHSSFYRLHKEYEFHKFWRKVRCIIRIRNQQSCQAA